MHHALLRLWSSDPLYVLYINHFFLKTIHRFQLASYNLKAKRKSVRLRAVPLICLLSPYETRATFAETDPWWESQSWLCYGMLRKEKGNSLRRNHFIICKSSKKSLVKWVNFVVVVFLIKWSSPFFASSSLLITLLRSWTSEAAGMEKGTSSTTNLWGETRHSEKNQCEPHNKPGLLTLGRIWSQGRCCSPGV